MSRSQSRAKARKARRGASRPSGQWIRSDLHLAIYLRDGFRCVYCGADLHGVDAQDLTLDHVHPWSLGGENDPSNLVTACRSCNCSRGARKLTDYADDHTKRAVRRQTKRSIARYRKLARNILAGECPEINLPTFVSA